MVARRLGDPSADLWTTLGFGPPISAVSPSARGSRALLAAQSQSVLFKDALPGPGPAAGPVEPGVGGGDGPGPGDSPSPGDGDGGSANGDAF